MSKCTVYWEKSWQDLPVLDAATCRHPGTHALTINQRLEPVKRGGHQIAMDASICMACGSDSTGALSLADGLKACMDEHGWNREVGLRLYDIAGARKDELLDAPAIPIWCLYAFGYDGRQIVNMLNDGALHEAETAA